MKDLASLRFFVRPASVRPGPDIVIGRVDLAGKVIEHDAGYRAQHAHVAELIAVAGTERAALGVANRLGLRLAPPPDVPKSTSPGA